MQNFSQIYIMVVFGVKYRLGLIEPKWENQLHAVIGKQLNSIEGVRTICIGGFKDHLHELFSTTGKVSESEIIKSIKTESSKWINRNRLTMGRFAWQEGSGRFSYSFSQLPAVIDYIKKQRLHHQTISFRDEYIAWLKKYEVEISKYNLPEEVK